MIMKRFKICTLMFLAILFLTSCGDSKLSFDQGMLSSLFRQEDDKFFPGELKWNCSRDDLIEYLELSDSSVEENDGNELILRNPIKGVHKDVESYLNFGFDDDQLAAIELGLMHVDDRLIRTIIEWAQNNFSEPQMIEDLNWGDDVSTLIESINEMNDQSHTGFIWNGTDASYFSISFLKQGDTIVQIRVVRPQI